MIMATTNAAAYRIIIAAIVTSALVPGCLAHGWTWGSQPDASGLTRDGLREPKSHRSMAMLPTAAAQHGKMPANVGGLQQPETSEAASHQQQRNFRRKRSSPEGAQHVQNTVFMTNGQDEKSPADVAGQPDGYRQQWPTLMQEIKEYTVKNKRGAGNRIGDRFIGMRGKKLPAPSEGFVGMRGKKDDGDDDDNDSSSSAAAVAVADDVGLPIDYGHHKRPSLDAFYAMRGKKDEEGDNDDDMAADKRRPKDGFLGMRGKKLRDGWKSRINNVLREIGGVGGGGGSDDDDDDDGRRRRQWTTQESVADDDEDDDVDGSRSKKSTTHFNNFLQKWANQLRRRRMTRDDHRNRHVDDMFIGMRG